VLVWSVVLCTHTHTHTHTQTLNLEWNKLERLPPMTLDSPGDMASLSRLTHLNLRSNAIRDLRPVAMCARLEEVLAEHNPVVQPPEEVCRHGLAALRRWVRDRRDQERHSHLMSLKKAAALERARLEEEEKKARLIKDLENRRRIQAVLNELEDATSSEDDIFAPH